MAQSVNVELFVEKVASIFLLALPHHTELPRPHRKPFFIAPLIQLHWPIRGYYFVAAIFFVGKISLGIIVFVLNPSVAVMVG